MRASHPRLSIAALAVFTVAGGVAHSQNRSPEVLNTMEVRELIASAEPGAHARLSTHFAALAERNTADARRHTAMSQSFGGNPSRNLATGMSAHCKRLAELGTQSATTLRELAAHHKTLAAGAPSTAPKDSTRFEGGAGAPQPNERELSALAAKAGTPADHRGLEEYFVTLARRHAADADEHVTMAQAYRGTRIAQAAAHCDRLVTLSREAAKEATAAAAMHKQLAGVGR